MSGEVMSDLKRLDRRMKFLKNHHNGTDIRHETAKQGYNNSQRQETLYLHKKWESEKEKKRRNKTKQSSGSLNSSASNDTSDTKLERKRKAESASNNNAAVTESASATSSVPGAPSHPPPTLKPTVDPPVLSPHPVEEPSGKRQRLDSEKDFGGPKQELKQEPVAPEDSGISEDLFSGVTSGSNPHNGDNDLANGLDLGLDDSDVFKCLGEFELDAFNALLDSEKTEAEVGPPDPVLGLSKVPVNTSGSPSVSVSLPITASDPHLSKPSEFPSSRAAALVATPSISVPVSNLNQSVSPPFTRSLLTQKHRPPPLVMSQSGGTHMGPMTALPTLPSHMTGGGFSSHSMPGNPLSLPRTPVPGMASMPAGMGANMPSQMSNQSPYMNGSAAGMAGMPQQQPQQQQMSHEAMQQQHQQRNPMMGANPGFAAETLKQMAAQHQTEPYPNGAYPPQQNPGSFNGTMAAPGTPVATRPSSVSGFDPAMMQMGKMPSTGQQQVMGGMAGGAVMPSYQAGTPKVPSNGSTGIPNQFTNTQGIIERPGGSRVMYQYQAMEIPNKEGRPSPDPSTYMQRPPPDYQMHQMQMAGLSAARSMQASGTQSILQQQQRATQPTAAPGTMPQAHAMPSFPVSSSAMISPEASRIASSAGQSSMNGAQGYSSSFFKGDRPPNVTVGPEGLAAAAAAQQGRMTGAEGWYPSPPYRHQQQQPSGMGGTPQMPGTVSAGSSQVAMMMAQRQMMMSGGSGATMAQQQQVAMQQQQQRLLQQQQQQQAAAAAARMQQAQVQQMGSMGRPVPGMHHPQAAQAMPSNMPHPGAMQPGVMPSRNLGVNHPVAAGMNPSLEQSQIPPQLRQPPQQFGGYY